LSAPVNSLATEAALLLDAVAARLEALRPGDSSESHEKTGDQTGSAQSAESPSAGEADDRERLGPSEGVCPHCGHDASATVTCTACPLCRLLAVLRGERPETLARLVDTGLTLVRALRTLLPEPDVAGSATTPGARATAADEDEPLDSTAATAQEPSPESRRNRPRPGVERIVIR
jgi:hypothetical protein